MTITREQIESKKRECIDDIIHDIEAHNFNSDGARNVVEMHLDSLISTHYIPRERVEAVCKSHNLETEYENPDCGVIDHTPQWDGNYYTCRFCGKEFILKDNLARALLEDNKE